ncbi:MAG: 50S ribosomal protein L23 [Rickettsiales bacterium]|jgi:large subunit ribosomal protein L23|nr:50S ribosomal protein L23 [Rickettsiales bacterium]
MAENKEKIVKTEKKVVATAGTYDVLRRPIISEKSARLAEANGLAFEVAMKSTKKDVAKAVQAIYNITPAKVNIIVAKGKANKGARFKGVNGVQKDVKKAYITLKPGDKIEA